VGHHRCRRCRWFRLRSRRNGTKRNVIVGELS